MVNALALSPPLNEYNVIVYTLVYSYLGDRTRIIKENNTFLPGVGLAPIHTTCLLRQQCSYTESRTTVREERGEGGAWVNVEPILTKEIKFFRHFEFHGQVENKYGDEDNKWWGRLQ